MRRWLGVYVKEVGIALFVTMVMIAIEASLLVGVGHPGAFQWFLLGAISVLLPSVLVAGLGLGFLVSDPIAIRQLRGAWGEENTREELARAARRGHIWGWVDSVTLAVGDIDHLVVTRKGGLVAIDSKWRSRVDAAGRDAMIEDANASRRRAEGVVRTVLSRERSGRRADGTSLRVRPVVVLWGPSQSSLPDATKLGEVEFVRGSNLVRWLASVEGDVIEQRPAEQVLARIEQYRAEAWSDRLAD